jgi:hypothetical protein
MNIKTPIRQGWWITHPVSFTTKVRQYDLGETLIPEETVMLAFRGSVAHGMLTT